MIVFENPNELKHPRWIVSFDPSLVALTKQSSLIQDPVPIAGHSLQLLHLSAVPERETNRSSSVSISSEAGLTYLSQAHGQQSGQQQVTHHLEYTTYTRSPVSKITNFAIAPV